MLYNSVSAYYVLLFYHTLRTLGIADGKAMVRRVPYGAADKFRVVEEL